MGSTTLEYQANTLEDIDTLISCMANMKRLSTLTLSLCVLSQSKASDLGSALNRTWENLNINVEACDEGTGVAFLQALARIPNCPNFSLNLQGFELSDHTQLNQNLDKCIEAFKDHLQWANANLSGRASMALQYLEDDVKEISDAVSASVGYGYNQALTYMQSMNPRQYLPSMPQVNPFAQCMAPCMQVFEDEQTREERITRKKYK